MARKEWVTQDNYSDVHVRSTFDDMRKNPETFGLDARQFEKKTVPDQTLDVKEIMKRYEKGRPKPEQV